jgi:hypothetical protein
MQSSQQLNRPKFFCRASFRQRVIAGIIFLVVAASFGLLVLAAHYKIALGPPACGFKQRYHLPCPGCGMTTSAFAFAGGKVFEAFYIQPAAALLCCVLVFTAFLAFFIAVFGVYSGPLERFFTGVKVKYVILVLLVIIATAWVVTLARALAASNQG